MSRAKTQSVFEKLCEVIPGGVNSPVRSCKMMGQLPMVADRAEKDTVYDADGKAYIDYCGSWGPMIHGHSHPKIIESAIRRMAKGTSFGITTEIEEKLARKVTELVPSVEKIRFVSSGTEATMTAVRVARGFTGKPAIIKFSGHYHGHADFFLVKAGSGVMGYCSSASSAGVPPEVVKNTICLPFNDLDLCRETIKKHAGRLAAVILEPIAGNMGLVPAGREFMEMLREETKKADSLLIFDEVITGFRLGLQGAQGHYGVKPDLTCFGKIIGGGFPAAAFGGRKEIMDTLAPLGNVYQAGTLSGNPVAMEAGLQSLLLCEEPNFYQELERKTTLITQPVMDFIHHSKINACIQQAGSLFTLFFGRKEVRSMEEAQECNTQKFAEFFRYMFENGVYIPPLQFEAWFVSGAHSEENLLKTRDLILAFLKRE